MSCCLVTAVHRRVCTLSTVDSVLLNDLFSKLQPDIVSVIIHFTLFFSIDSHFKVSVRTVDGVLPSNPHQLTDMFQFTMQLFGRLYRKCQLSAHC